MRLDLRKLRFRQPKLVATHLCLLFGSRESRHYVRANTFMGPDPSTGYRTEKTTINILAGIKMGSTSIVGKKRNQKRPNPTLHARARIASFLELCTVVISVNGETHSR